MQLLLSCAARQAAACASNTGKPNTQHQNSRVEADIHAFAIADDLLLINDISVDESEDLPKILGPLVEEGPLAALGRAHQQAGAAFSPATNKRHLLQTMKLAAPAIVKLQVPSVVKTFSYKSPMMKKTFRKQTNVLLSKCI